jgi:hypothetical protein
MLVMFTFVLNNYAIMKNTPVLLIIQILFYGNAWAQAPVVDSTWLPSPGDKYYTFKLTPEYPFSSNDSGAGVTWDFDSLFWLNPVHIDSFDFVVPATRYIPCAHAAANLASGDSANYFCYIKNSSGVYYADWKQKITQAPLIYDINFFYKSGCLYRSSFYFRQAFTDTFSYTYHNIPRDVSTDSNHRILNIINSKYDGYGLLKIAGRRFDTTIRIYETGMSIDSIYNGSSYEKSYALTKSYYWFTPAIHVPVLMIDTLWDVSKNGTGYDTLDHLTNIQINLISSSPTPPIILLPPDLRNGSATFSKNQILINGIRPGDFSYALYDMEGRLIDKGVPLKYGSSYTVRLIPDINISPGMYILQLYNRASQVKSIKIVKDN